MKKFNFKLETLLKVKKEKEKEAQKEFFSANQVLERLKEQEQDLKNESREMEELVRFTQKNDPNPMKIRDISDYLRSIKEKIFALQDDLMKAANIVEGKRRLMVEAMAKRKSIDKLKEKQYEVWEQEIKEAENKFIDDLAVMRYLKNKK